LKSDGRRITGDLISIDKECNITIDAKGGTINNFKTSIVSINGMDKVATSDLCNKLETIFIRGSNVRYLLLPYTANEIKNSVKDGLEKEKISQDRYKRTKRKVVDNNRGDRYASSGFDM